MKAELIKAYEETPILRAAPKPLRNRVNLSFIKGPKVEITGPLKRKYFIEFIDRKTGSLKHNGEISTNNWIVCNHRAFTEWEIIVSPEGEKSESAVFCAKDQRVFVEIDSSCIGDTIAWIPYIEEFRKKHSCKMICSTFHNSLIEGSYPNIEFVKPGSVVDGLYAMYVLGCFIHDGENNGKDYRLCALPEIGANILGIPYDSNIRMAPTLVVKSDKKPHPNKYVCISMASTMGAKHWNNPTGWQETVNYLKKLGYDVILLQTQPISYMGSPDIKGVIHPKTSIEEVLNYLLHAEFFIGLSSGISWLAWALDKKVVMISGFTKAINEFYTPWRIINKEVCNGCWNELNELNKGDWNWCPHHKNSSRHFECTKTITFERVKIAIENLIASKSQ